MYKIILILLMSLSIQHSFSQCKSCSKVNVKINVAGNKEVISNNNTNNSFVTLYYMSGFNDTLSTFHNKTLLKKDFYLTDFSSSNTSKHLELNFKKKKKNINCIKIVSLSDPQKSCCFELIDGYKIVEVHYLDNVWRINFSNEAIIFE
jgi:hypothetical protein